MWWFEGGVPIVGDGGIDDFPTAQTPPADGGLAHDSALAVLQRDGHHQALAPLAHHVVTFVLSGAGYYASAPRLVKLGV